MIDHQIAAIHDLIQPIDSYICNLHHWTWSNKLFLCSSQPGFCLLDEIMSRISIKQWWILLRQVPKHRRSRDSLASTTFLSWMATAPEEPPGLQGLSGCKYYFITSFPSLVFLWKFIKMQVLMLYFAYQLFRLKCLCLQLPTQLCPP